MMDELGPGSRTTTFSSTTYERFAVSIKTSILKSVSMGEGVCQRTPARDRGLEHDGK